MFFEGEESLFTRLREKRDLLRRADMAHEKIRPLLWISSGVMRGVSGIGAAVALKEAGLSDVFDVVVGVSAGAPTVAYFLGNNPEIGATMFWEECCTSDFINFRRLRVGTNYLSHAFQGETGKPINLAGVARSRSRFYVVVSNHETGRPTLFNAKAPGADLFMLLEATIAMPGLAKPVAINGSLYADGASGMLFPTPEILERFKATDVFIIANRPKGLSMPLSESIVRELLFRMRRVPRLHRLANRDRYGVVETSLDYLQKSSIRWGVWWSDLSVRTFTTNKKRLRNQYEESRGRLSRLLVQ